MKSLIKYLLVASLPLVTTAADLTGRGKAEFHTQVRLQKYLYTSKPDGANVSGEVETELDG